MSSEGRPSSHESLATREVDDLMRHLICTLGKEDAERTEEMVPGGAMTAREKHGGSISDSKAQCTRLLHQ
jgi:hypothetical protein